MTKRAELEQAIDAALELGGGPAVDEAIALLDAIDGDCDVEDDEREPIDFDEDDLPPLMDGGWGYGLGRLPVYDQCPCCGHRELAAYALPVIKIYDGQCEAVL